MIDTDSKVLANIRAMKAVAVACQGYVNAIDKKPTSPDSKARILAFHTTKMREAVHAWEALSK
jgi:hypothetical protein